MTGSETSRSRHIRVQSGALLGVRLTGLDRRLSIIALMLLASGGALLLAQRAGVDPD